MKLVVKFGGTSISSVKKIRDVANYLHNLSKKNQIITVCSAISGVTDDLIQISKFIQKGNKENANKLAKKIIQNHKQIANELIKKSQIRKKLHEKLNSDFTELEDLVHGMILLGEVTPRSMDYLISFGERLSINLVAFAIQDLGSKSIPLTGKEVGIVTDSNFGEAKPLMDTTRIRVSKTTDSLFSEKIIPVVGGFTAADQHGNITTFGRGGSDYTATTIAACVKADEIWLMTDVD